MKRIEPLTLKAGAGSTKISLEDATRFFGAEAIAAGEKRGAIETRGPWNICVRYTALATTATWRDAPGGPYVDEYTLHGDRTMYAPREAGHNLEGRVSIDGRKRSAFTSSIMFELPDGRLINVACIHARGDQPCAKTQ